ncbi:organomercurial lyase [Frankia sp. QA3]|uniref:organomercurial lyase n=1 Tax=Frankia sp. QA3 TaxID=710111 RepID=UPI000269C09E|nr:organomercurial lyase [Frankia sp. QA3]EIV92764.1 Alkylmercury lyase [Frankia sp. QA3]
MTLSELAERTRFAIYTRLAADGALPPREELARQLDVTPQDYDAALTELAQTRNVVLKDGEVEMAHPFATRSFGFSVMGARTLWWGGCAWDSFAIPNLVPDSPEVLVATTCPACGTAHAWTVTNQGPPEGSQVAHFLTPADRIWPDAAHACENQLIFCSEGCVEDWLARTGNDRGYVMSLETLWRLAAHWYEGRLDTPYVRREPVAAADYFRSVGLHGPFWGLPEQEESR